jgi:hypothetical protein
MKTYEVDYDKVKTLKDVKLVLKSLELVMRWEGEEVPDQFKEVQKFFKEVL